MDIPKFTIYGERCSGTNYLERIIKDNFDIKITWEYGLKHFFGFNDLTNSNDTLFICIVRNPVDWLNSLYRKQYHIARHLRHSIDDFLNKEFYSFNDDAGSVGRDGSEFIHDRNIYSGERYKNIFEMRHTKIKFCLEDVPKLVKNYIFVRYEDLINDFENTLYSIKRKGLKVKNKELFPQPLPPYEKKTNEIPEDIIFNNPNFNKLYEEQLNYL